MNDEPLNPYSSPSFAEPNVVQLATGEKLSPAILIQQRMVAVLLIIHGLLGVGVAVIYAVSAVLLPEMLAANGSWGPDLERAKVRIAITSAIMSACGFLPGILQIVAGFMNLWLKRYTLGLIAIGSSLAMVAACYLRSSALLLFVYGGVIYLWPTTRRAFALAEQGHNFEDLWATANASS